MDLDRRARPASSRMRLGRRSGRRPVGKREAAHRRTPRRARASARRRTAAAAPAWHRAPRCRPPRPRIDVGSASTQRDPVADERSSARAGARAARRTGRRSCSGAPHRPAHRAAARQRAGAGAEFPDLVGPAGLQRLRDLPRQRRAEQRRQFRRGDEVAARRGPRAELAAGARVVAEARRIQRHRHEAVERQPAAVALDGLPDQLVRARPIHWRVPSLRHRPIVETVSSRPVVLVTGAARRLGRAIALDLGAHGWDVARALPPLGGRGGRGRRCRAARGRRHARLCSRPTSPTKPACRALRAGRRGGALRPLDAVVNNASTVRVRHVETLRPSRHGAPLARQHRARRSCWRSALHAHLQRTQPTPAASSTCSTRSSGTRIPTTSRTPCRRRRCRRPPCCWRRRWRRRAGVRRRAGRDAASGPMSDASVRGRASADAARALVDAGRRRRARCASCSSRPPSPAPRCWSTAASTWPPSRAT